MESRPPQQLSDIDWDNWQARAASLVFVVRDDQVLLIRKKRGLGAGKINGPGGRIEPGESVEQCAMREIQEELHITPTSIELLGENRFHFVDGYTTHVFVYRAEDFRGEPTETEEAAPLWFPLDQIPYAEMWEDDYLWVPLVIQRRCFSGRFLFDVDKMIDYDLAHLPTAHSIAKP